MHILLNRTKKKQPNKVAAQTDLNHTNDKNYYRITYESKLKNSSDR